MIPIVVTGLGVVSPVGMSVAESWQSLLAGRSGIAELQADWAAPLPSRVAGLMARDPADLLDRVEARKLDRASQGGVAAAREAWADAGLAGADLDPVRVAVVMGTAIGGMITLLDNHDRMVGGGYRRVSPRMVQMNMPNATAAAISIDVDARAGAITTVSACASGSEAIAHAADLIRLGRADVVLAGGAEACIHPVTMAGFAQAHALSTANERGATASRPFDVTRDGFVIGEGAGVVVLESEEHARARGARHYAYFGGGSVTSDAHDMVSPHPSGAGQTRAMTQALAEAGLAATDIDHVNAHATSTPTGDLVEARALRELFGASMPVVSATKSMTGHMLGASGAFEAVATVLAIRDGVAPPTPTLTDAEPDLGLDVTRGEPRRLAIRAALSNSFGFGGHNASLVFHS